MDILREFSKAMKPGPLLVVLFFHGKLLNYQRVYRMIKTGSEWQTLTHEVIPLVLSFMLRPANSQHTVLSSNIGKMMTLENPPVSKDIPILSFVYVYIYIYIHPSKIYLPHLAKHSSRYSYEQQTRHIENMNQ